MMNDRAVATTQHDDGRIVVATVDNPPVNALSHAVRAGLLAAVERFERDDAAHVLLILCAGKTFIAGADIREFGSPMQPPLLGTLIDALDRCEKPIVAAMHGTALGGGLEVALACSYRIADQNARLGFPEVKLGILPGSGGSVRLPRLIGVPAALTMIAEGHQVSAREAEASGLVDAVITGDFTTEAIAYARGLSDTGAGVRRISALAMPPVEAATLAEGRTALRRKYRGFEAPQVAVDLMERAIALPFAEAAQREYETCKGLLHGEQSKALRHLFVAERAAQKSEAPPDATPYAIRRVAVIGPGTMGRGIASLCLGADIPVTLLGLTEDALDAARDGIAKGFASSVKRGTLSAEASAARMALLTTTLDYAALHDCDIAIEAVTEDLAVKHDVLAALSRVMRPDALIATNTSFLDIEALSQTVARPERFLGLHFFNPATVMQLVETVRAAATSPATLMAANAFAKRLGKIPVTVGRSEGFVANRMLSKRSREAQFLVEEGASPAQVDRILTAFGFPIGPFALADLAGLDIMAAARAARKAGMTEREKACDIVERLVAAGRLGQKSGAGYYAYDASRRPIDDPATDAILADHRAARGVTPRTIDDQEIIERCVYALVNEGAKILQEGAAQRPGDIDVIWTKGLGFPAYRGGPMFYADSVGLPAVAKRLEHYSKTVGDAYFRPASLLAERAADGRGFYD